MRKAFNFYRSYYDVAKELSKKDREEFLMALLQKQFEGIEPKLEGMAKFAYLSQQHSIDSQVVGYEQKTKEKLTPTEGGCQGGIEGGTKGGSVQEEEKGKEKEEVEYTIHPLVKYLNTHCKQVQKLKQPINDEEATKLLLEFDKHDLVDVFMSMENTSKLTTKYNSANLTVRSWIKRRQKDNSTFGQIKQPHKFKASWQ